MVVSDTLSGYKPLALLYRPIKFEDVIGQDLVKRVLMGMLSSKRIGSSYLFAGPRGTGKTSVARIFSKALNCKSPDGIEPCCKCKVCQEIASGKSADVVEYDSASAGSVSDVRNLRESSHYRTMGGGWRVWILDECHSTSREGFNSLLKIMEEPPPRVVFVLATTEVTKIPDTIASRCYQLPFRAVTLEDTVKRLRYISDKEQINIKEDLLNIIAQKGGGHIRDSITILDQLMAVYGRDLTGKDVLDFVGMGATQEVGEMLVHLFSDSPESVFKHFRKVWSLIPDSREFIRMVSYHLRNVGFVSQGLSQFIELADMELTSRLHSKIHQNMMEVFVSVTLLEKGLQFTRLNPQILIEMWLLSLFPKEKIAKVADPLAVETFWNKLK